MASPRFEESVSPRDTGSAGSQRLERWPACQKTPNFFFSFFKEIRNIIGDSHRVSEVWRERDSKLPWLLIAVCNAFCKHLEGSEGYSLFHSVSRSLGFFFGGGSGEMTPYRAPPALYISIALLSGWLASKCSLCLSHNGHYAVIEIRWMESFGLQTCFLSLYAMTYQRKKKRGVGCVRYHRNMIILQVSPQTFHADFA